MLPALFCLFILRVLYISCFSFLDKFFVEPLAALFFFCSTGSTFGLFLMNFQKLGSWFFCFSFF
jgi:hypothetical protein